MADVTTKKIGATGEMIAKEYLLKKGYTFIEANWACKAGEIDLIMQDGSTRVFIEVRLRAPTSYGAGLDTIAWQKQGKIIRATQFYQLQKHYWDDIRFDVVSIEQSGGEPRITHISHAFTT